MKGWVLGVLLTIVSAAGSTSGLILQKIAHTREQKAVKDGIKTNTLKCFDIPCNKYFIAGFIMLAFVPLPFDFVALANAGQSIAVGLREPIEHWAVRNAPRRRVASSLSLTTRVLCSPAIPTVTHRAPSRITAARAFSSPSKWTRTTRWPKFNTH